MFCPSCYLPEAETSYLCVKCAAVMCESCATFALHCRNIVCRNCETHDCDEENCQEKLLVNMTVDDLLKTFCNEDVSTTEWERMGKEYPASDVRVSEHGSTRLPFTNVWSFPQIRQARLYRVSEYTKVARWAWRQIRLANRPAQNVEQYVERVNQLLGYDFVCWYQHRSLSTYATFEDRIFEKPVKSSFLRSMYYGPPDELARLIEKVKEVLLSRTEAFSEK